MNRTPAQRPSVRVLLVEDNPGDALLIRTMLAHHPDVDYLLDHAQRLEQALQFLARKPYDVLLLDLSLPDSQGLDTFHRIRSEAESVPVVVLTGLNDSETALQAVQQGAQDYLVKGTIDAAGLHRALQYAMARHQVLQSVVQTRTARESARSIAFVGVKGGSGTTTCALNVAAALATRPLSTLYIELTAPVSQAAALLGLTTPEACPWLHGGDDTAVSPQAIQKQCINVRFGLRLLLGPRGPDMLQDLPPEALERLYELVTGLHQVVVWDISAALLTRARPVLTRSHLTVLVLERDLLATAMAQQVLAYLRDQGVSGTRVGALVVSKSPLVAAAVRLEEIRARLDCSFVEVVPPAPEALLHAQRARLPLVLHQPQNPAAAKLRDFAHRLTEETLWLARTG